MFLWLIILLLDVAVRRIVLDFRAIWRKIAALVRFRRAESKEIQTLERLRIKRQTLRDQLLTRSTQVNASRRYESEEKGETELPSIKTSLEMKSTIETKPEKPASPKTKAKRTTDEKESSHIDKLLKAKRKAADRDGDDKKENIESDT
jgi:hypothetical protein